MFWDYFQVTGIAVAQIFLLGALGFLLVKKRFLSSEGLDALSRLVMNITLPLMMFCQLIDKFSFAIYPHWWSFPVLSALINLAGLAVGWCFKGFIRGSEHRWQFISLVGFQNSGYLPLALIGALLPPEKAAPMFIYLFLFLIGFNAVIFSFGVHLISFCDDRKFELKSFFSPPVIAMSFSLLLIYLQAHKFIPESLRVPLRSIGDCTLPLAMLVVGGMLARIDIGKVQKGPLALAILLKLVVLPLVGLLVCLKLGLPELFSLLIIIELAVPSATTLSILVRHFKKEDLLISQGIFFSHLFSIVTIPLFLTFYFWLKVVK